MPPSPFPTIAVEQHTPASEPDALLFEADALREHAGGAPAPADPTLRIDHAMPGHIVGTPPHGAADGARGARGTEPRRHLTVRHHVTSRNPPHEAIDRTLKAQPLGAPSLPAAADVVIVSSQSRA